MVYRFCPSSKVTEICTRRHSVANNWRKWKKIWIPPKSLAAVINNSLFVAKKEEHSSVKTRRFYFETCLKGWFCNQEKNTSTNLKDVHVMSGKGALLALWRSRLYIDVRITIHYTGHKGDNGSIQNCQSYCLKVSNSLGNLGVDGRIMLKFFYNIYSGVTWFHLVPDKDQWLTSRSMKVAE
jgi:hypothetical protein